MAGASSAQEVHSGMVWGVHERFVQYITRVRGNVQLLKDTGMVAHDQYFFQLADASQFNRESRAGDLQFHGGVLFTAHSGMLQIQVSEPRLSFTAEGAELGIQTKRGPRTIVRMGPPIVTEHDAVTALRWDAPTLTAAGADFFGGVYGEGDPCASLHIRI